MISMANLNIREKAMRAADRVGTGPHRPPGPPLGRDPEGDVGGGGHRDGGDVVTMQDIFVFEREGVAQDGRVAGRYPLHRGSRPRCSDRLQSYGISLEGVALRGCGPQPHLAPVMDIFRRREWSAALLAFGAVALAVLALANGLRGDPGDPPLPRSVMKELKRIRGERERWPPSRAPCSGRTAPALPDWLRPIGAASPPCGMWMLLLEQSRSSWSLGTVLLLTVGCGGATGSAVLVGTRNGVVALVMAAFGATLPLFVAHAGPCKALPGVRVRLPPRPSTFLVRSVRAGARPSWSAEGGGKRRPPEPVAGEFQQVLRRAEVRAPVAESLLGWWTG